MHIPSKHVYETLKEKGVTELYHANSVATASLFLKRKSLMSRGSVERQGLFQTSQYTDDADKRYSLWFDIFMDTVDIHRRARRKNSYGPVIFVFDIEILNRTNTGRIWATKLNPTKWAGKNDEQRWFKNKTDLKQNLVVGNFDHMIVLRHCGGVLPFGKSLKKIIVDDPKFTCESGIQYFSLAVGALGLSMAESGLDASIIAPRKCTPACNCENNYSENPICRKKMFYPFKSD